MPRIEVTKHPRVAVAGILQQPDGQVLLGRRKKDLGHGLWAFPGGSVEWGESLQDGVRREFREETGLSVRPLQIAYIGELIRPEAHFVLIDFWVTDPDGFLSARSDLDQLAWVGPDEVGAYALASGMAECLADPTVRSLLGWRPS